MSRYRKIETKTWADAKFKSLSPLQPSGQALWLWLLTGPQTGIIPGLFYAGEKGMAELLGWNLESFRKAFQEGISKGMVKHDRRALLVWIPRAIHYNKPQSPNVIKSWYEAWENLPECVLKAAAWQGFDNYFKDVKSFREAFRKGCEKPLLNQEQEQEQEQDIKKPPLKDCPPQENFDLQSQKSKPKSTQFIKPTLDQIQVYNLEIDAGINAEEFLDFYTANGWTQGKGKPIKNWQACIRTWKHNSKNRGNGNGNSLQPTSGFKTVGEQVRDELKESYENHFGRNSRVDP